MDTDRRGEFEIWQVLPGEHVDFSLVDSAHCCINAQHRDIGHLHDRVDHLRDRRMVHLPADLVHVPGRPGKGDLLEELVHEQFVFPVELKIGTVRISHS